MLVAVVTQRCSSQVVDGGVAPTFKYRGRGVMWCTWPLSVYHLFKVARLPTAHLDVDRHSSLSGVVVHPCLVAT
jgi:hypothetical protein